MKLSLLELQPSALAIAVVWHTSHLVTAYYCTSCGENEALGTAAYCTKCSGEVTLISLNCSLLYQLLQQGETKSLGNAAYCTS